MPVTRRELEEQRGGYTVRKVRCGDCGKSYDYDDDAFCPRCGAFNQPPRGERLAQVRRADGLNEAGHQGSFLHREFHEEERERRRVGLDQSMGRSREKSPRQGTAAKIGQPSAQGKKKSPLNVIVWVIFAIIAFNILSNFLFLLL